MKSRRRRIEALLDLPLPKRGPARQRARQRIAALTERLIDLLDQIDHEDEAEPNGDEEASLVRLVDVRALGGWVPSCPLLGRAAA